MQSLLSRDGHFYIYLLGIHAGSQVEHLWEWPLLRFQDQLNLCFKVPPGEFLEGSLIDEINDGLRCSTLVLDVARPALDLVWVPQDLFLIWKILLFLKETLE